VIFEFAGALDTRNPLNRRGPEQGLFPAAAAVRALRAQELDKYHVSKNGLPQRGHAKLATRRPATPIAVRNASVRRGTSGPGRSTPSSSQAKRKIPGTLESSTHHRSRERRLSAHQASSEDMKDPKRFDQLSRDLP